MGSACDSGGTFCPHRPCSTKGCQIGVCKSLPCLHEPVKKEWVHVCNHTHRHLSVSVAAAWDSGPTSVSTHSLYEFESITSP